MSQPQNTDKGNQPQFQQDWNTSVGLTFDQNAQPPKTRGEKIFNGLSWALFGWLANAAVSIKLADTLENFFRPIFNRYGRAMAESKPFTTFFDGKGEAGKKEACTLAKSLFSVIALLPGGYSVLVPIKIMEDRKVALVKKFDQWFGPSDPNENKKQLIDARHSYLEAAPKLNWGDMIKGRTLPVVGIVATHFAFASDKTNIVNLITGKQTFDGLNKRIVQSGDALYGATKESRFPWIKKATERIEQHLDKGVKKNIEMYGEQHYKDYNGTKRLQGYLNNISIDLLYSAIVAMETFILGHLSAFKREEKKEIKRAKNDGSVVTEKRKFHLDAPTEHETAASETPSTQLQNAQYEQRIGLAQPELQQRA